MTDEEEEWAQATRLAHIERKLDRLYWLVAVAVTIGAGAFADYAIRHSTVPSPGFWGPAAFGVTVAAVGTYLEWRYRRR